MSALAAQPAEKAALEKLPVHFRGVSDRSFDGNGNYALGLKEQIIFPEINFDKVDAIRGMDIIICTTAINDDQARALLKAFKMPFRTRSSCCHSEPLGLSGSIP